MSDPTQTTFAEAREIAFKHGLLAALGFGEADWVEVAEEAGSDWRGVWHFPIPEDDAATRLAWAAMRRNWMKRASDESISMLVHPREVLAFVESCPGLSEACEQHPEVLVAHAPFLLIPGFGGRFEQHFDRVLSKAVRHDLRFLRELNFGDVSPYAAMHKLAYSGGFDEFIKIKGFEFIVWLLSAESEWLPEGHHSFLIEAAKAYGAWVRDMEDFAIHDYAVDWEVFKRDGAPSEMIEIVKGELGKVSTESGWDVDRDQILEDFMQHGFIEAWLNPESLCSPNRRRSGAQSQGKKAGSMKLEKVPYKDLNSRQQEAYNLQKLSGVLADYGIITIKLSSDWEGADLIAQHCHTFEFVPIQLKGRFSLAKKYCGKGLWVAFRQEDDWYLYDHDVVLALMEESGHRLFASRSWMERGGYDFPRLSKKLRTLLERYRLV